MIGLGTHLPEAEYADLVSRVRETVAVHVKPGSSALVVSKGDPSLLRLPGVKAMHFPQDRSGEYAGHHPRDGAAATAELEERRRAGAEYLVIPTTSRWWLQFYDDFAQHLANHCELLADDPEACLVYGLGRRLTGVPGPPAIERPQASVEQLRDYLEHLFTRRHRLVVLETVEAVGAALAPLGAIRLKAGSWSEGDGYRVLVELRLLAADGARYLVVPRSSDEWLESRAVLRAEIESTCRNIAEQRHLCRVFDLDGLKES
jgi:hypothetical protein